LIVHAEDADAEYLIKMGNELTEMDSSTVSILFAEGSGRIVSFVGRRAVDLGVHAGRLATEAARVLGGGGGGEPHFGQGGGRTVEKVPEAMNHVREYLRSFLAGKGKKTE